MTQVTIDADLDNGLYRIHVPYKLHECRERLKENVYGVSFNDLLKTWDIPASPLVARRIEQWVQHEGQLGKVTIDITDNAHELTDQVRIEWQERRDQQEESEGVANPEYGNLRLYPFQRRCVERLRRRGGGLMAHEMGSGKTPTSLVLAHEEGWYPLVVVCPASVKLQWAREVEKWLGQDLRVEILDGMADDQHLPSADIYVCNYSILADRKKPKKLREYPGDDIYEGWVHKLIELEPRGVIFDEAHYLSNHESSRSQAAEELLTSTDDDIDGVVMLTGTPLVNTPRDLIHPLKLLGVIDFWGGPWGFLNEHIDIQKRQRRDGRIYNDFSKTKNLDELHEYLDVLVMDRVRKQDVIEELPPITRTLLPVHLSNPAEYKKAEEDYIEWIVEQAWEDEEVRQALENGDRDRAHDLIDEIVRRALAGGEMVKKGVLLRVVGEGKVPSVVEVAKNAIEEGEAPIVFTRHRGQVLDPIVDALRNEGYDVSVVEGTMSGQERQQNIDLFQDGVTDVFCGTMGAAGTGLTLTRAHTIIFAELPWTAKDLDQAEQRAWARLNDLHAANSYFVVAEDTVDHDVWNKIMDKREVSEVVIDGGESDYEVELLPSTVDRRMEKIMETVS